MNADIGAPFEGPAVDRGREGVVDDGRNAVFMSDLGVAFDIEDGQRGIGDRFAEEELRVGTERGVDLLVGPVGFDKRDVDPHFLERDVEKIERAAVNSGA